LLFLNTYDVPLSVTCLVPLPADGAVSNLALRIGSRHLDAELTRRSQARQQFTDAVAHGRTAALLESQRPDLFTQELCNVPAGAEVEICVQVDHPLQWLADGFWELRFPTVTNARYSGKPGRVPDAAEITPEFTLSPETQGAFSLTIDEELAEGCVPSSTSHSVSSLLRAGRTEVRAGADFVLDRDVVVRWSVPQAQVGLSLARAGAEKDGPLNGKAFGLLALTPPRQPPTAVPRDLVLLLDTSGSMGGPPLNLLKRLCALLITSLNDRDRLSMVRFGSTTERWMPVPSQATSTNLSSAMEWIRSLNATGGTEMGRGVREALRTSRPDSVTQVVLISDGDVGFEREVWQELRQRLPKRWRLHAVGVGSCTNRSLTSLLASAGRGKELFLEDGEDVERVSARLLRALEGPLVTDLCLSGGALRSALPERLPDLMAGEPALLSVELNPEGGELLAQGSTASGPWSARLVVPPTLPGDGSSARIRLFGRRLIDETERQVDELKEADAEVERLGLLYRIATRCTSWVVSAPEATVEPGSPSATVRQPHAVPAGKLQSLSAVRAVVVNRPLIPIKRVTPGSHLFGSIAESKVMSGFRGSKRKASGRKKKQAITTTKEVRFSPKTAPHDYEFKLNNVRRFLSEGHQVRVVVQFRGREVSHSELGNKLLEKLLQDLAGLALVIQAPRLDGKRMIMLLQANPRMSQSLANSGTTPPTTV
jgi:Ca-activated chloride channel family protein